MWKRRDDFSWRPPRWLAAAAVGVAAVVYITIAWSARFPVIPFDEIVMVGNSRVIAGVSGIWHLSGGGFMPGLAILMAPAWWFTSNPIVVYQVGVWITVALSLLAIWPLSAIAERAGLTRTAGVIVSAVVAMAPARALLANYLLSESALLLATAALLVVADRLWTRGRNVDALWFGVAVGATVLSHGRGVGTAVAAGLWCLMLLRRDPKRAILAGASALVAASAVYLLYRGVSDAVLGSDGRVGKVFSDLNGRDLGASAASAIGQVWYATLAWPTVAVLGGMAVIRWRRRSGMALFLLLAIPVALIMSTVQLDPRQGGLRMDPWFYGRYMDTWWSILAVIGLAVLIRVKWPAMSVIALGASVVSGLSMLLFTVRSMPQGLRWEDTHVLGITPWLRLDTYGNGKDQAWGVIVLTGLALTLLLLALGFIRVWVLPTIAALWIWLSIAQDIQGIDLRLGPRVPIADSLGVNLLPAGSTVGIEQDVGALGNLVVFGVSPVNVVKVDAFNPPAGIDFVYVSWLRANDAPAGVKILGPTLGATIVAWVEPGELQRQLDAEGLLAERTGSSTSGSSNSSGSPSTSSLDSVP
jgi:hypothetical protein